MPVIIIKSGDNNFRKMFTNPFNGFVLRGVISKYDLEIRIIRSTNRREEGFQVMKSVPGDDNDAESFQRMKFV